MGNYKESELRKLSIYELRAIAREVGVQSPTTKRHCELIENILKIQSGEQQAFSSNKGRPHKKITLGSNALFNKNTRNSVFNYYSEKMEGFAFCSGENVDSLNNRIYPCRGMLREIDGQKFVYSYINAISCINISNELVEKNNLKIGDYVVGLATETNPVTAHFLSVQDVNFNSVETTNIQKRKKIDIKELTNLEDIYERIKAKEDKPIKIVIELEVDNASVLKLKDECIYFYSKELDDVQRSFNALLDCLKIVQNLSIKNKPFTVYLVDIDYIFNILNVYFKTVPNYNLRQDIDAGHFLKTIFSNVKNSENGNLVILESKKYHRNEYLDSIINKYL